VLRLAVLRCSEVRVSLDVVLVILADVLAVGRCAVRGCAVGGAVGLDVVTLVVVLTVGRCAVRGCAVGGAVGLDVVTFVVVLTVGRCAVRGCAVGGAVGLDVLLFVDPVLWPLFHLNCLLFDLLNLHTRRWSLQKSSRRRFKNAMAADILRA
jgi:hypothetical protein